MGGIAWKPSLFGWDNTGEFGKPSWPDWAPFLLAAGRQQSLLCLRSSPVLSLKPSSLSAFLSSQIIYPSDCYLLLLAHGVLHLKFNISGQILLGQRTGEPWSTSSPFQECTVSYDPEEMVFKRKEICFPTVKKLNCEQELCSMHENCLKKQTYRQHLHNRHLAAFSDIFF